MNLAVVKFSIIAQLLLLAMTSVFIYVALRDWDDFGKAFPWILLFGVGNAAILIGQIGAYKRLTNRS